ncbi:MAG: hypothetical protein J5852_08665 [Clostridia bacterium]|nr:hypothetical protein [Clostridia bacterium]
MKSRLCRGEIFGLASSGEIERFTLGEIKSVLHPAKRDFTAEGDFTLRRWISPVRKDGFS